MTQKVRDSVMPEGRWTFDGQVTDVLNDMLERSIPQYQVMRRACFDMANKYIQRKTAVVDLGMSRGEAVAALIDKHGVQNHYVGVEVSKPMLEAARRRFRGMIDAGVVDVRELDLRADYPRVAASVTLCVLTLQFTPIEYRLRIMQNIYEHTVPGGCLILVEKVLGASASIDRNMVDIYYKLKADNGYSQDQIERKRLSLEGVLVPVTAKWNEELMRSSGFREVDCFWRWQNFAAWVAVK